MQGENSLLRGNSCGRTTVKTPYKQRSHPRDRHDTRWRKEQKKRQVGGLGPKSDEKREPRDPEDREVDKNTREVREKMMDKTPADSFPTSDPPSTIPNPEEDDSFEA
jgi:hypothetical protein